MEDHMKSNSKLALLVGAWLTVGSVAAVYAKPLTGEYANKNSTIGESIYRMSEHSKTVFVFHHFGVEVC
jgi:hypothetical protein